MITLMGKTKVFTAPEVLKLFNSVSGNGFIAVEKLPDVTKARRGVTYYVRTDDTYVDDTGKELPVMVPYVIGDDPTTGEPCWYTSGAGTFNYANMRNIPSINGEKLLGDMDEAKARAEPSADGVSGGYGMSLTDKDIMEAVAEADTEGDEHV